MQKLKRNGQNLFSPVINQIGFLKKIIGITAVGLTTPVWAETPASIDSGDTAWMLISTALVLLMIVPGLALFYVGMVRAKNALSLLTQILCMTAVVMVLWPLIGYSLAFSGSSPFIGDLTNLFLKKVTPASISGSIPEYVFICYQMTFAAITAALALGGFAERIKFKAVMLFTPLWLLLVYLPLAHMVWSSDGYFFKMGALDFAGGTVVHINAGISALVGCLIIGKRSGYNKELMAPHSMMMTLTGTGLLWVGWFGFNAGSALGANGSAGLAMINSFLATATAILTWISLEAMVGRKPSLLGACSGAIAGLVAITPAAGNAGPMGGMIIGILASFGCFWMVIYVKPKLQFDDALDAFGVHGIGGIIGSIATGLFCSPLLGGPGNADYAIGHQLLIQVFAVAVAVLWSAIGSTIVFFVVDKIVGLRVSPEEENIGLDISEHDERAYN
ncbi:MAG: ammonium transporter, partial [Zymomonas mobilis subsp. pomaceae]